jgi:hypothetical protein
MKPDNVFLNAALAAVTATGMSYLFLRYAPMGPQAADPERIERIISRLPHQQTRNPGRDDE